jgi:hypothetical protein
MTRFGCQLIAAAVALAATAPPLARAANTADFQEVYEVIRTNIGGMKEADLNVAAVEGFLAKLDSKAWLIDPNKKAEPELAAVPISSSAILDESYGYIRISRVGQKLADGFSTALAQLTSTNKLKGLVIDLRFAGGTDYAAAVKVADSFLGSEQPLLDWGKGMVKSTDKTNAFRLPVAVLVNQATAGAAEALAAALRQADIGLIIGTNTAGHASITKDFPLTNGQILRVAISPIKAGNGDVVERLKPDIRVDVNQDDERAYFVDAYKILPKASTAGTGATNVASLSVTNKSPRRRINEAELVRMLRDGENPDDETVRPAAPEPPRPIITDPALSRALDLLKGLAVVRHTRF